MQPFRRVGEYLKRKYNGATHVMIDQGGSGIVVANHHFKKPTRKDLVYLESSPDYCLRDLSIGKTDFICEFSKFVGFVLNFLSWQLYRTL